LEQVAVHVEGIGERDAAQLDRRVQLIDDHLRDVELRAERFRPRFAQGVAHDALAEQGPGGVHEAETEGEGKQSAPAKDTGALPGRWRLVRRGRRAGAGRWPVPGGSVATD